MMPKEANDRVWAAILGFGRRTMAAGGLYSPTLPGSARTAALGALRQLHRVVVAIGAEVGLEEDHGAIVRIDEETLDAEHGIAPLDLEEARHLGARCDGIDLLVVL